MFSFGIAFIISLCVSLIIIKWSHGQRSLLDSDLEGVQKIHTQAVPRVGGIALYTASFLGTYFVWLKHPDHGLAIFYLLCSTSVAVIGGILEDITKKIRPRWRMACMAISAIIMYLCLDIYIPKVDIPWVDTWLKTWPIFGFLLTMLAMLTMTNAINIIDGLHGLAGFSSVIMLAGLAFVARFNGDAFIVSSSLLIAGATMGFLVLNYPLGRLFLGDGGAYFLGFILAALSIALVQRNPLVSAWFPVLLLAYPLVEVSFSVYRRRFLRGVATGQPDAAHLHQLIFKRILSAQTSQRNAKTTPYLWVLTLFAVIPATIFYQDSRILVAFFILFCVSYVWLYASIVSWHAPRWLKKIAKRH